MIGGAVAMLYSFFMDVSYDGYVNIHLLSKQRNILTVGGILFIAGVIMSVSNRSKNTIQGDKLSDSDEMRSQKQSNVGKYGNKLSSLFKLVIGEQGSKKHNNFVRAFVSCLSGISLGWRIQV